MFIKLRSNAPCIKYVTHFIFFGSYLIKLFVDDDSDDCDDDDDDDADVEINKNLIQLLDRLQTLQYNISTEIKGEKTKTEREYATEIDPRDGLSSG